MKHPYELIESNEFEEAIELIDAEFSKTQNHSLLNNKILALLNLKRYGDVIELSQKLIEFENGESEAVYKSMGIAYWITGNNAKAVKVWQQSQNCMYKDAASGIEIQVLLFFAAVKMGQAKLKLTTVKTIKKLLKSKRSVNWPGVIGHLILDKMTESELFPYVSEIPILKERQLCQLHFASAIKKLEQNDLKGYYEKLKYCVSYGALSYLEKVYYLAIGELEMAI